MRKVRWVLAALLVLAMGFAVRERVMFDRAAWLADYDQLRRHINRSYANLVDSVRTGAVDPVALHRRTLAGFAEASTDRQARAVLEDFIAAFGDGHLRLHRVKLAEHLEGWWYGDNGDDAAGRTAAPAVGSAEAACDAIGIRGEHRGRGFASDRLPGFVALDGDGNSFRAGVVALDGSRVGILRISSFDQTRYRAACLRACDRRPGGGSPCDDACQDRLYSVGVPEQLLGELAARLDALAEHKIDLLAIDLTGNGGGNEWSLPAARLLSSNELACPRQAFIKHPRWTDRLRATLGDVERDLRARWSDAERTLLIGAQARVTHLLQLAAEPCDLEPLWTTPGPPSCTHLVEDYSACGVFPDLPAGALATAASRNALDHLARYQVPTTRAPPRIVVVINERTASAAEMFAAMLIDSGGARAIGRRSAGLGCGYTRGALPAILEHSRLRVDMPDCLRRRADGRNERSGIDPEFPIAWSDDDQTRREQLLDALRRALQQP